MNNYLLNICSIPIDNASQIFTRVDTFISDFPFKYFEMVDCEIFVISDNFLAFKFFSANMTFNLFFKLIPPFRNNYSYYAITYIVSLHLIALFVNNIIFAYYHFISEYAIIIIKGGITMIINRLSILLAERGLSGAKFAISTKIAQSTISKITTQKSKQIDYKTLNTICNDLSIEPKDFFEYSPYDFEFSHNSEEHQHFIFVTATKYGEKSNIYEYQFDYSFSYNFDLPNTYTYNDIIENKLNINELDITYDLTLKEETIIEYENLSTLLKTTFLEELKDFVVPLVDEIFSFYFKEHFNRISECNDFYVMNRIDNIQRICCTYSLKVEPIYDLPF